MIWTRQTSLNNLKLGSIVFVAFLGIGYFLGFRIASPGSNHSLQFGNEDFRSPNARIITPISATDFVRQDSQSDLAYLAAVARSVQMPPDKRWGSHVVPLFTAVWLTQPTDNEASGQTDPQPPQIPPDSPVLELGCGFFSTPMLQKVMIDEAGPSNSRYLLSTDSDKEWLEKVKSSNLSLPGRHDFIYVSDDEMWDTIGDQRPLWGVVFVDHKPAHRRIMEIERLRKKALLMVVHDTQSAPYYGYKRVLPKLRARYTFRHPKIHSTTDIVSDLRPDLVRRAAHLLSLIDL